MLASIPLSTLVVPFTFDTNFTKSLDISLSLSRLSPLTMIFIPEPPNEVVSIDEEETETSQSRDFVFFLISSAISSLVCFLFSFKRIYAEKLFELLDEELKDIDVEESIAPIPSTSLIFKTSLTTLSVIFLASSLDKSLSILIVAVICGESICGINEVPILVTANPHNTNKIKAKPKTTNLNFKQSFSNFS